jgi:hypothetical protein
LQPRPPNRNAFEGRLGRLLFSDEYRGKAFIKGIVVQEFEGLMVGVDLSTDVDLDFGRDRNCINEKRLAIRYMGIWSEAICSSQTNEYVDMIYK